MILLVLLGYVRAQYCLAMEDEFTGTSINKTNWKYEITLAGGGNDEFQWYTDDPRNSYVKNGSLYLMPTYTADVIGETAMIQNGVVDLGSNCTWSKFNGCRKQADGKNIINPIRAARLQSKMTLRYGRVEVKAKLPRGDWLWPAIWMLPNSSYYGEWPRSGEIDIMESRGNNASSPEGIDYFASTLHWGMSWDTDRYLLTQGHKPAPTGDFGDTFYTYGVEWTPSFIRTYLNAQNNFVLSTPTTRMFDRGNFGTYTNVWDVNGPFDQDFYLILNLAVGGTNGYFSRYPDAPTSALDFWNQKEKWSKTWGDGDNKALIIDSVRMWKRCIDMPAINTTSPTPSSALSGKNSWGMVLGMILLQLTLF